MKKIPLLILTSLFLFNIVYALDLEVNFNSDVIIKEFENSIEADAKITNLVPGFYNFYTFADLRLEPSNIFQITAEEELNFKLTFSPTTNLKSEGPYTFVYTLNHRGIQEIEKRETIKILGIEKVFSLSSEEITIKSDELKIYLRNNENVQIEKINITFTSDLFEEFVEELSFEPFEQKEILVGLDQEKIEKTRAGSYVFSATIQTPKGAREISGTTKITEEKGIITTQDSAGFLIVTDTITKVNAGNVLENIEVTMEKNMFSRLFTSFNIQPSLVQREGSTIKYTWIKERLGPTEVYIIKAKTNYLMPLLIIIFLIILLIGLKRYSETKIEVQKSVSPIKAKNGEFALKIRLNIKAKKYVENVAVIDKIPAIVKLFNKFETIKPDKIDSENRRVHWNLGDLNAGEERAISYIVYSKVGVVGKFSLPEALIVFEKDGKVHEVESSKVYFMNESGKD